MSNKEGKSEMEYLFKSLSEEELAKVPRLSKEIRESLRKGAKMRDAFLANQPSLPGFFR